ncbi:MAG TPA: YtxH domain-containing protein [Acidobacteriota bacterium]|jgi:gas vesicle protein|nr:YtxH domain-containing protein [Acidobacteriota bacterium]
MHRRKSGSSFTFLILGGIIGASAALLFAPTTGRKTRKMVARYGKQAGSRAQSFVSDIADTLDYTLADILEAGTQGFQKGKKLTNRAGSEILTVLEAGRKYLEEEKNKLEKMLR